MSRLLLGDTRPEHVADFVAAALGPLLSYDARRGTRLVDTVAAWYDHGGRVRESAEALHVHPNTVGQRLERVAELLGADWREPSRSLDLQLALRMHALRNV